MDQMNSRPEAGRPTATATAARLSWAIIYIYIFTAIALGVFTATGVIALMKYEDLHAGDGEWGPEISLRNFSVSNLSITGDQISGNWSVELGLHNALYNKIMYADIKYNVVYSGVPIVDNVNSPAYPLLQRPKSETAINLYGSSEKLRLSHLTADSMTRDVIDNGALEFDLVAVALIMGNYDGEQRIVLTCKGVKVLVSASKTSPMNATGRATKYTVIPACDLVRLVDI